MPVHSPAMDETFNTPLFLRISPRTVLPVSHSSCCGFRLLCLAVMPNPRSLHGYAKARATFSRSGSSGMTGVWSWARWRSHTCIPAAPPTTIRICTLIFPPRSLSLLSVLGVQQGGRQAVCVRAPQDGEKGRPHRRRCVRDHPAQQTEAQLGHHHGPRLRLRLLRLQDPREVRV